MYPFVNRHFVSAALIVLTLSTSACNLPRAVTPTPFTFPTPNLTLTSVFATAAAGTQAVTTLASSPEAGVASATFLPTQPAPTTTLAFNTATLPASATLPLPTATFPIPTATTAPTRAPVSNAGPGARPGPSLEAIYLNREPTMDGVFDDWDLDRYEVNRAVYGRDEWDGEEDLSAQLMLGWDEEALYIAARVFDDRYVQGSTRQNLFEGDSIEILLDKDVAGDFYRDELSGDDFQLGISPGSPAPGYEPEAYLWFPSDYEGRVREVSAGASPSDVGYRIEAKIPWEVFGVNPKTGMHYGFAFSVSDNDHSSRDVQESMVSSAPGRVLTDPTTWGDLVLSGRSSSGAPPQGGINAPYLDRAPTIDGGLGEWELDSFDIDRVVYGDEYWRGEADLSGQAVIGWDEDYLYLGARIYDDQYVQNSRGEELFLGDSLEILMDSDLAGDRYDDDLSGDDYQLGLSPGTRLGEKGLDAYLWFPRGSAGMLSEVEIAAAPAGGGYTIEAAIPWWVFGIRSPDAGDRFGFVLSISDNDNEDREEQQSMVSNINTRILTDPSTWGELALRE